MKNYLSDKQTVPVPRRGKIFLILAGILILTGSIAAGAASTLDQKEIPVLLADGSVITPPWYITVDGEKVALVESQEAAEETLQKIVDQYRDSENTVLDIEVKEQPGTERMKIKNGDAPPEILSVAQAEKKIQQGKNGKGYLTVVTTEERTDEETIAFEEEYRSEPEMYVGETKVEVEGKEGTKEVTKKVVKENGKAVEEEIVEEQVTQEPTEQVVLTGIKEYDGYGGAEGSYDEGVSYDLSAAYGILKTPIDSVYISSEFGQRWGRLHRGIDFALAEGSAIYAADAGSVYFSGYSGGYGNIVKIDHGNGMQTYYAHCSQLLVSEGQSVQRGEQIALVGSTGNSTGPHLHFEVIINGACVNPINFLEF